MMQTFPTQKIKAIITALMFTGILTACAEWSSKPAVVEANFGDSVRNMVKNQTLYPEHNQNDKPVLSLDGQKAQGIVKDYRDSESSKLDKAKQAVYLPAGSI
jgi:hypothetical protein